MSGTGRWKELEIPTKTRRDADDRGKAVSSGTGREHSERETTGYTKRNAGHCARLVPIFSTISISPVAEW